MTHHSRRFAAGAAVAGVMMIGLSATAGQSASAADSAGQVAPQPADRVVRPWLGYGINYEPEPNGGTNTGVYTDAMAALEAGRMDEIRPQVARVTWLTTGFAPGNKVGEYDWSSNWAQNEFKALDYLKARNIPVMIGFWTTPWDATGPDYATAAADLLEHLVKDKGYTNIKWWNGVNEPNHRDPRTYDRWRDSQMNVAAELMKRGLDVTTIGPGTQDFGATQDWLGAASTELAGTTSGYSIHYYPTAADSISAGRVEPAIKNLVDKVDANDPERKPFFVEELGDKSGWDPATDRQPRVTTYGYGLDMADLGIQLGRAGVSSPMAWRLSDVGSPKLWGMWNGVAGDEDVRPWAYSWAMLSRAFPAGSRLFAPAEPDGLRVLAAEIPAGRGHGSHSDWSFALVNRSDEGVSTTVRVPGAGRTVVTTYKYSDGDRPSTADGLPVPDAVRSDNLSRGVDVEVPAGSFVVVTTLAH